MNLWIRVSAALNISAVTHTGTRLTGLLMALSAFIYFGCGGTSGGGQSTLEVPVNLPDVCQGIDFNLNVEMRDVCGVKVRSYRAYKNVTQYRLLLRPKGAKIVKKGSKLELRLQKTIPIDLPASFTKKIEFSESVRNTFIKSSWDYQEFFPEGETERIKIMKIQIPFNDVDSEAVCFSIPPRAKSAKNYKKGYSTSVEHLSCEKFDKLKSRISAE